MCFRLHLLLLLKLRPLLRILLRILLHTDYSSFPIPSCTRNPVQPPANQSRNHRHVIAKSTRWGIARSEPGIEPLSWTGLLLGAAAGTDCYAGLMWRPCGFDAKKRGKFRLGYKYFLAKGIGDALVGVTYSAAVLGIRGSGSAHLTNGSSSGSDSFLQWLHIFFF